MGHLILPWVEHRSRHVNARRGFDKPPEPELRSRRNRGRMTKTDTPPTAELNEAVFPQRSSLGLGTLSGRIEVIYFVGLSYSADRPDLSPIFAQVAPFCKRGAANLFRCFPGMRSCNLNNRIGVVRNPLPIVTVVVLDSKTSHKTDLVISVYPSRERFPYMVSRHCPRNE
jgi:hypothetical protein